MTGLIKNDKAPGGLATAKRENVVEVRDLTVSYEIRTRGRRRSLLTARASTSTVRTISGVHEVSLDILWPARSWVSSANRVAASQRWLARSRGDPPGRGHDPLPRHAGLGQAPPPIGMVLQDPQASLNPRQTVGSALNEPLHLTACSPTPSGVGIVSSRSIEEVGLDESALKRYPQ